MSIFGWVQIFLFALAVVALAKPLGVVLFRVFEDQKRPWPRLVEPLERALFRIGGIDAKREQTWLEYAGALLLFSALGVLVTYALQRLQHALPLNPQKLAAPSEHLAFNTAASFASNTDWQSYAGESTLSYLTQMAGLTWQNFVSAASGIGVALAVARGLTRKGSADGAKTLGNFWVDLVRATFLVLLPASAVVALFFVSQGVLQNLSPYLEVKTLEGGRQLLAMGPVASQEAIKLLGTNGGGFFNANSAHPFENPTPTTNFLQLVLVFAIPAALTYTFGRMARDQRQGWALFAAMMVLFAAGVTVAYAAESRPNPALASLALDQHQGNLEGKEVRFGVAASALFATVTTDASCGAVNAMHDSFTPLGGLVPLLDIMLGEVVFGGVGAGLYGILVFVLLSVFIAGLMVGRTPEYLGKKIEAREMTLAVLYVLVFPALVLVPSAWAVVTTWGTHSLGNAGPHGLSEILYAFASGAGNNGSAFAGLDATTPWWTLTLGATMLAGRFLMIVPALAIAGSMRGKKDSPPGPGTFPTCGPLFAALLVGVVVVVGALTFFPALALGPIAEHFAAQAGRSF
ncbi:MAG TPA: potassium-transporting ATPase subunit KdpA [Myxococcales bacterium]